VNPTTRSRIAGWAALGVAIAIPLKFAAFGHTVSVEI
jgi:hypothetical protein